jgi:hypothetical protein
VLLGSGVVSLANVCGLILGFAHCCPIFELLVICRKAREGYCTQGYLANLPDTPCLVYALLVIQNHQQTTDVTRYITQPQNTAKYRKRNSLDGKYRFPITFNRAAWV